MEQGRGQRAEERASALERLRQELEVQARLREDALSAQLQQALLTREAREAVLAEQVGLCGRGGRGVRTCVCVCVPVCVHVQLREQICLCG